jgi:copper(I)-binding protein
MNNALRLRAGGAALAALLMAVAGSAAAEIKASDAWVRATPPGSKVAAAYLTLTNTGDEERRLLKIVSTVTDEVTLHRTSMTSEGVARMWPLAMLALAPGEILKLEPNGVHVMFNALKSPLVAGQKVPLTIKFDGGEPEFTVLVEVRPLVPAANAHH